MARRWSQTWRDSHSLRRGQPASTQARSSSTLQRAERPMWTGCGIRPAASHVRQVRSEMSHIAAAVRAVASSGVTSEESTTISGGKAERTKRIAPAKAQCGVYRESTQSASRFRTRKYRFFLANDRPPFFADFLVRTLAVPIAADSMCTQRLRASMTLLKRVFLRAIT